MPVRQVARLGLGVLDALATAHAAGVLHRDIKPGNIFVGEDGAPVLTDFGIATVEGQATIIESGMLVGSPGYIAPERLRGERPGPQSDLWSLAATLYEAAEGEPALPGGDAMAVLAAVLTEEALPPRRSGSCCPAAPPPPRAAPRASGRDVRHSKSRSTPIRGRRPRRRPSRCTAPARTRRPAPARVSSPP
ncbi:serine/threonine-protein kinase [Nonomuraea sp. B1E8]|uniref:serine/threonine-protein kinase n=1 Tax=unclassified Nonomuraea TaxID=2593643 RepID=UPI00325C416D